VVVLVAVVQSWLLLFSLGFWLAGCSLLALGSWLLALGCWLAGWLAGLRLEAGRQQ